MDVQIFVRHTDEGDRMRRFLDEKVRAAVSRFEDNVVQVTARLEDETGPDKHTENDKVCTLDVKLRKGQVLIKENGDDFMSTIDIAVDRLRAALSREISKHKHGIGEG